ncbi:MAG: aminotransferase class I/II-fold pyridoxal phosphate-dependent enzyme [Lachnospiraceae bacterium]|nr:aminotransferase class I/II-fold pyridoxal phosphate-dependent enzyme [Lachnospiraceae bacterium]
MDCKKLICSENSTIREVMACINNNSKGIVFVVNGEKRLSGIATDGDIRRALLNGAGMKEPIKDYMNENFVYALNILDAQKIFQQYRWKIKVIPLVDADMHIWDYAESNSRQHVALAQPQLNGNEYNYLMDAFLSTWISSTGKYITQFEEKFSQYCGVQYGVAVSNGTTALHLALVALGVGAGDEVIVPDITFAATINAVIYTGATPVIVDIEDDSWCIDPNKIEKAITLNTKAIIPVHIYGQPCDMGRICEIARNYNLYIVEDCAEAHGAEWDYKKVGSFGIISCFSFFGNKVLTTGEGGMCITNNKELNDRMRVLRDHGMSRERKYYHEVVGFNYRMTNMQAAIGVAQLEHINEILEWRQSLEERYRSIFSKISQLQMQRNDLRGRKKIAWLVSVLVDSDKRDEVLRKFKQSNVDARPFFIPLSEMDIYKKYAKDCTVSRRISRMGLNLPTTYEIDDEKIECMAQTVGSIL